MRGIVSQLCVRVFHLIFAGILLLSAIYARAGGGGGYRSGSGSSSSRSSSSSSSSRSSYSGSSSSSSYRSSGSGSSTRSSGSYSSGPTYVAPTDIKSVRREFNFAPETIVQPNKIEIRETITFTYKGLSANGFEYTPAAPNGPWSFFYSHDYDKNLITLLEPPKTTFRFKLRNPEMGKDYTLKFNYVINASATPTATGAVHDFYPYCPVSNCIQIFTGLPPGSYTEFYAQTRDDGTPSRLIKTDRSQKLVLAYADFGGARYIRVNLAGAAVRESALNGWLGGELALWRETEISIAEDGSLSEKIRIKYQKESTYKAVIELPANAAGEKYLYRNVQGVSHASLSDYTDSYLALKERQSEIRFEKLGLVNAPDGSPLRIALGAITQKIYEPTHVQVEHGFINQHGPITLMLPPALAAEPALWECKRYKYSKCEILRPLKVDIQKQGNTFVLRPHEAQVTGLWLIELKPTAEKLKSPALMTRLSFGWGHYHSLGNEPAWVAWFYILSILFGLILLIWLFVHLKRRAIRRMSARKHEAAEQAAIAEIKKRDPDFNVDAFRQRGREIAVRIQEAWCAGDMRPMRRFLSQGVYNRFRLQLRIMREFEKKQNAMADFEIHGFYITQRRRSGEFDALVVRLEAGARDVMTDADKSPAEAKKLAEKSAKNDFAEYYTFMRRRDAKTHGVLALDACAKCGTPFAAEGETNKCKSCAAVMGSGQFDWVLAEITQEVEYQNNRRGNRIAGEISADRIEDRASFVFWRDIMARLSADNTYLRRDATNGYLQKGAPKENLSDISVGAADLEHYDDALSPIEAHVRIKWSASLNRGAVRHRESILTLKAKPEEETGSGFAEHSCENCGGPLPETDSETCSYCRSPIQSKNHDWLLDNIETTVE